MTFMPLDLCHLSHCLLSMIGTSTACSVFGLSLEPVQRKTRKNHKANNVLHNTVPTHNNAIVIIILLVFFFYIYNILYITGTGEREHLWGARVKCLTAMVNENFHNIITTSVPFVVPDDETRRKNLLRYSR